MAHWRLAPAQMVDMQAHHLEMMELSFLLLERRQTETLDNLIGGMLGTTWDAASLMGANEQKKQESKQDFTWSFRQKKPQVNLPLTLALTTNPKFMDHLKKLASNAVNVARENPSVVNAPKWVNTKKEEIIDLSYVPIAEFKKFASRLS